MANSKLVGRVGHPPRHFHDVSWGLEKALYKVRHRRVTAKAYTVGTERCTCKCFLRAFGTVLLPCIHEPRLASLRICLLKERFRLNALTYTDVQLGVEYREALRELHKIG